MDTIEIEKEMIKTKKFLDSVPKLISELKDECESYEEEYKHIQSEECDSDEYYGDELTQISETMSSIDRLIKRLETIKN